MKKTKLMQRMFSTETPQEEKEKVAEAIQSAESEGAAETDDLKLGKVDGKVYAEDKENGEVTAIHTNPENPKSFKMEAVKTEADPEPEPPKDEEKALCDAIVDTKKAADAETDPEKKAELEQKTASLTSLYSRVYSKNFAEPEEGAEVHTMSHHNAHSFHSGLAAHHRTMQKKFSAEGNGELADVHEKLAGDHEDKAAEHAEAIEAGKGDEKTEVKTKTASNTSIKKITFLDLFNLPIKPDKLRHEMGVIQSRGIKKIYVGESLRGQNYPENFFYFGDHHATDNLKEFEKYQWGNKYEVDLDKTLEDKTASNTTEIVDTKGTKETATQENVIPNENVTAPGKPIETVAAVGEGDAKVAPKVGKTVVASESTPVTTTKEDEPPKVTETTEEVPPVVKKPEAIDQVAMSEASEAEFNRLMDPDKNNKGFEVGTKKAADPVKPEEKPGEEGPKVPMEEPVNAEKQFSAGVNKDESMSQFDTLIQANLKHNVLD